MTRVADLRKDFPNVLHELTRRGWTIVFDPLKDILILSKDGMRKTLNLEELDERERKIEAALNNSRMDEVIIEPVEFLL